MCPDLLPGCCLHGRDGPPVRERGDRLLFGKVDDRLWKSVLAMLTDKDFDRLHVKEFRAKHIGPTHCQTARPQSCKSILLNLCSCLKTFS